MDNLNVFANEDNQVNGERPPLRVCPRCDSDNTRFCYYNNRSVSQPRYHCKNCRRYWTHGGALRNIPVGGSCRKVKRASVDARVSPMGSVDIQQVNHLPFPFSFQENYAFVGSFGASSSAAAAVGNHFGSLSDIHGGMVTNVPPSQSFQPDFHNGSFGQGYYDVGSGIPMINQSTGGFVDNRNGYRMNQVGQHLWNPSFNNNMNMDHNASTSGSRGYNYVAKHPGHLEMHGPNN